MFGIRSPPARSHRKSTAANSRFGRLLPAKYPKETTGTALHKTFVAECVDSSGECHPPGSSGFQCSTDGKHHDRCICVEVKLDGQRSRVTAYPIGCMTNRGRSVAPGKAMKFKCTTYQCMQTTNGDHVLSTTEGEITVITIYSPPDSS